ncbi:MAG TPA: hypothetical protein VFC44_15155 [Candidatus Saccharimonadales bacterium]|nr:hypothetical protein [Candidatus Saccharimonadales bacterium]
MHKWLIARRWASFFLLAAALCCGGCQTSHPYVWAAFDVTEPGWKVWNGQAVWKPRRSIPELTGDVLLAVNTNGSAFIQFTKTLPFAMARLDGQRWQIDFPDHRIYKGHYPLPRYFAWLQLPALTEGRPLAEGWTETGGLAQFDLRSRLTGETLHGYLLPP